MQYQEFLDHIYQRYSGNIKLGLERMEGLLEEMGSPQNSLRGFHVGGTNGKGSVCASLEALCLAHGFSTGLNTSPHLINYTERFRVNGRELGFQRVLDTFLRFEYLFQKWDASFFEITTAIAMQVFKEEAMHSAVMEVGLGGRLDATNPFTPDVSAITSIGLDHVKTLGGTIKKIATEKAGIIKPGIPLVLGKLPTAAFKVITQRAKSLEAPLSLPEIDYNYRVTARRVSGLEFDYSFGRHRYRKLSTNLIGEHQAANLALALTAFFIYAKQRGFKVCAQKVRYALKNVNWPGRMQVLSTSPVIIADGAHNIQGVRAVLDTLSKIWPQRRFRFLISILADKNFGEMLRLISQNAQKIYIAQNSSERAATVEEQAAEVRKYGVEYMTADSVPEALKTARAEMSENDILICGGSLFTVGEVLRAFSQ